VQLSYNPGGAVRSKNMAGHEYHALIHWARGSAPFTDNRYSRGHTWRFDGGIEVPASSSPSVVRPPLSVEAAIDPEEAFVASLSSCHMLWFLDLAAKDGWCVDDYRDDARGLMGRDAAGRVAMLQVVLRPRVLFAGARRPQRSAHEALHHRAHESCFIANSVKTAVGVELAADA
jgi:organic hydroperoxide reductase OsmC/OhrA